MYNSSEFKLDCDREDIPNFFKFGGQHEGQVNLTHPTAIFSTPCFEENNVTLEITSEDSYTIHHKTSGHKDLTCGDGFFYSDLYNYHAGAAYWAGDHKFEFKFVPTEEMETVKKVGVFTFRMCDKVVNIIPDFILTMGLLISDLHLPVPFNYSTELMVDLDWTFIYEGMGYEYKERINQETLFLDPTLIKSGDMFGLVGWDGITALIQYGSGSFLGHCTVALWYDDGLYILESVNQGIIRTPWIQWVKNNDWASIIWLPLRSEIQEKFNVTGAQEFFNKTEGMPYGYENFLLSWVDTKNESLPPIIDPYFVAPMFALAEHLIPGADMLVVPAMLKRLNISNPNTTLPEIANILVDRGMEFPDLFPIPEQDGWWYGDHYSFVCSAYVTAIWKSAGLFDGLEINAVEFTPRDAYELNFIDTAPPLPKECIETNPGKALCQIAGKWEIHLPHVGTIEPYSHMNENCPTVAPEYYRPDGC